MGDYWDQVKTRDPYIFKKAEEVFQQIDADNNNTKRPSTVCCLDKDQQLGDGTPNPVSSHGRVFRLDDDSLLLIQFMRPKVWRLRFDPSNKSGEDFSDYNTRTIIRDTLTSLIQKLDEREGISWDVELIKDPQYYVLQSVVRTADGRREPTVQLWIQRNPFQITAVRAVQNRPVVGKKLPEIQGDDAAAASSVQVQGQLGPGLQRAAIWRTKERPLKINGNATVLSMAKSVTADYTGFGEHGGKSMFKKKTFLNYFNFDNMKYQNVYGIGPMDDREPLYHSEPYWIEMDGLPHCKSHVATFVDNYSHVCVDIGMADESAIRVATRFNSFSGIFVAGDNVSEIIQSYTSITGRPRLKPRYALGNHQGGYGYDTKELVLEVAEKYKQYGIPLDGMHIDVDMQEDYRTFTIDKRPGHFPQPEDMFARLRQLGVKCCTNITPYISSAPNSEFGEYQTHKEAMDRNLFIMDDRDVDPSAADATAVRYQQWSTGQMSMTNPSTSAPDYWVRDDYTFADVYNSKNKPFHGGIYYGWHNGHPGHFPNLNNKDVRKWWGTQYKYLFETGLDFVWQDMTSPCIAEQYGDMKSLPFRLLLESDGWSGDPKGSRKKKAIEIWHLYSYNLHKATYHGLNVLHKTSPDALSWRANRRNLIIGRGSFSGMHRYAGLWTGDNSSTWDFLNISVAQVLAVGLSGITVAGADVGGFEFAKEETKAWADPELLIRWYCAYSLLPWFRNHYTKYRDWFDGPNKGQMRKDGKDFQEPYAYLESPRVPHHEMIYKSVLPVCRYMIRLRYSLLQLLYDSMFENLLTGLPIARSMIITDEQDRTLFSEDNQRFTHNQYFLRNDLLIAPTLSPESTGPRENNRPVSYVYLPYPDSWYAMNLRPDDQLGVALSTSTDGGSHITYNCEINDDEGHIPYVNPMYIREGAIIPKIEVRDYIPDPSLPELPPNPVTIHVYPGKDNCYEMYLDDGISRDSAPDDDWLAKAARESHSHGGQLAHNGAQNGNGFHHDQTDPDAGNKFSKVVIQQTTKKVARESPDGTTVSVHFTRTVSIISPHNGFRDGLAKAIGPAYTLVFWHDPATPIDALEVVPDWPQELHELGPPTTDFARRATRVVVPVETAHGKKGATCHMMWNEVGRI